MHKVTRPYEVLVRIHPDGTAAAHVGEVEDIIDDDGKTVISSRLLPVKPLSLAGPEFDALVPSLDQAVLAQNAQLLVDLDAVRLERDEQNLAATEAANRLVDRIHELSNEMATLRMENEGLKIENESLKGVAS